MKEKAFIMIHKYTYKSIDFEIVPYIPRKNEFEKGLKWRIDGTTHLFSTLKECKNWITDNYFIFM